METNSIKSPLKVMPGTSGGKYLPFARKGNVLLGIRLNGILEGARFGVTGTTYFTCRLRSAPENGLFAEEDAAQTVVKLVANPANLWDAWPGVTWEKADTDRASTTIGIFLEGVLKGGGAESRQRVFDQVLNGDLTSKLAAYLAGLAGAENMIVSDADFVGWLNEQYAPVIAKIKEEIEGQAKFAELSKISVGNFGMQAEVLKKVYEATHPEGAEAEADEEGADQDEDESEEADQD